MARNEAKYLKSVTYIFLTIVRRGNKSHVATNNKTTRNSKTNLQIPILKSHPIQSILNHKQKQKIIIWLNQLTEQKYLKRYFDKKLATIPAAYSLGSTARKYFLKVKPKDINTTLLDRVWRESGSTQNLKNIACWSLTFMFPY